jgi:hypothetical protein
LLARISGLAKQDHDNIAWNDCEREGLTDDSCCTDPSWR